MYRLPLVVALASLSAPALADPAPFGKNADPGQRIKCKTEEVTGSLAGRRKVCMTVAEWERAAYRASTEATRMADRGQICTGASCSGGQ